MKKWYKSKTNQVNMLFILLIGLNELIKVLPEKYTNYVIAAISIVNLILRSITKEGIEKPKWAEKLGTTLSKKGK